MIVAVAGRRIDPDGAEVARFPLERVEAVREAIRERLLELEATTVVSSGACGTDLLALEVAGALGLQRHMILPFSRALFCETSVIDRPGDWGPLYDTICDELLKTNDLEDLHYSPEGDIIYAETNAQIVARAMELGRRDPKKAAAMPPNVTVLLVWEGAQRGDGDGDLTAHFGAIDRQRNIPVAEIRILAQQA